MVYLWDMGHPIIKRLLFLFASKLPIQSEGYHRESERREENCQRRESCFEHHYHEDDGKSMTRARREKRETLSRVADCPRSKEYVDFSDKLDVWLQRALAESSFERKRLQDIEKVKIYSMKHLEKGATQIKTDSGVDLSSRSICNMRRAAKKKVGIPTAIKDVVETGKHHLLCNDGNDILVFGTSSAFAIMSSSPMIHGDGTFTCTITPFSQLYIFHAVVANDTTCPMLYCLLKGKRNRFTRGR